MRPIALLALAVVVVVAAVGSAGPFSAPRRAADRRDAITRVRGDLDALVEESKVPAALALIRAYRRYTADQLAFAGRGIDVEMVLKVVEDEGVDAAIREEAASTLHWDQALLHDPQLDASGKGLRRPRAAFARKVLPLLVDKDVFARGLADGILKGLWPGVRDTDISACNPRNRNQCVTARAAWDKFLQK